MLPLKDLQEMYSLSLAGMIRSQETEIYAEEWPYQITHHKYINTVMFERWYRRFPQIDDNGMKVLDIGAGHQPSPVSDILGDRYLGESTHRPPGATAQVTRNLVNLDSSALPFADGCFKLSILSHVCEHLFPEEMYEAIKEATRVASECYVEVPNSQYEAKWGHYEHLYHIFIEGEKLVFDLKTREEWLSDLPKIVWHQQYRFHQASFKDLLEFRKELVENCEKYYSGIFLDSTSIEKIEVRKRPGALESRAELEELKKQYLSND